MSRIEVTFEVDVPEDANYDETLAWVMFETGANGVLSGKNPLSTYDLEADYKTVSIREI